MERLNQDDVGRLTVGDHDVLISGVGADGEASFVIGVEFVYVCSVDVYYVVLC